MDYMEEMFFFAKEIKRKLPEKTYARLGKLQKQFDQYVGTFGNIEWFHVWTIGYTNTEENLEEYVYSMRAALNNFETFDGPSEMVKVTGEILDILEMAFPHYFEDENVLGKDMWP